MRLMAVGPQAMHKATSPNASVTHPTATAPDQYPLAANMHAKSVGVGIANNA